MQHWPCHLTGNLIFLKPGSGNSPSCPSNTQYLPEHTAPAWFFFCWSPFIIVEFKITSFHPCLLFLSWGNPQEPRSRLDPLQRFPSFKKVFSLSVSRIPGFYCVYAAVETEIQSSILTSCSSDLLCSGMVGILTSFYLKRNESISKKKKLIIIRHNLIVYYIFISHFLWFHSLQINQFNVSQIRIYEFAFISHMQNHERLHLKTEAFFIECFCDLYNTL